MKTTIKSNEPARCLATTNPRSLDTNESLIQALAQYIATPSNRVNLNELVMKRDPFNGYSPREWIDIYEEAFIANDWSESIARKYFPTFLRGIALDWYKKMIRPKIETIDSWAPLRRAFGKHYLVKDELRVRRQELNAITQGPREPAINFIFKTHEIYANYTRRSMRKKQSSRS